MEPLKAKIFSYCTTNINPPGELQINRWLEENPGIEIVHLLQSESMAVHKDKLERNLSVTVFYRPGQSLSRCQGDSGNEKSAVSSHCLFSICWAGHFTIFTFASIRRTAGHIRTGLQFRYLALCDQLCYVLTAGFQYTGIILVQARLYFNELNLPQKDASTWHRSRANLSSQH